MSDTPSVEERLAAAEAAIAELQRRLDAPAENWLARMTGSVGDDPAFDEVLAYGREYRAGGDPLRD